MRANDARAKAPSTARATTNAATATAANSTINRTASISAQSLGVGVIGLPIAIRHNESLELNRVDYHGSVTLAELKALAEFNAANPAWLTYDVLSVVQPGAHFSSIGLAELDALFSHYGKIFAPLTFLIMRRSAWICESAAAEHHVRHWLGERDTKGSLSTDVRRFDTYEAAGDWLILNSAEVELMRAGEGFQDLASFNIPPALTR